MALAFSSLSHEELDGLLLELSSNTSWGRLSFILNASIELVPKESLLLSALQKVNLDRVVVMDKEPSSGVDELTALGWSHFTLAGSHRSNLDLAWRQKIDSWDGLVANSDLTLGGSNVNSDEAREILEESVVWSSHGKLQLWQFWKNTEVSHTKASHHWFLLSESSCGVSKHIFYERFNYNFN